MKPLSISRIQLVSGPFLSDVLHAAKRQRPDHPEVLTFSRLI